MAWPSPAGAAPAAALAPPSDPRVLALASQLAPRAHLLSALAVDLDRDGDLDLIASSAEELFVVWLNDGRDSFVRDRPSAPQMGAGSNLDDRAAGVPAVVGLPRSSDAIPSPSP